MANTKKTASADVKEAAVKTEAAETAAAKKETAKAEKPAAKRGRKPAAAKTENKPAAEKKTAGKPGRKPAAAKAEKPVAEKKPGRKPAAAKADAAPAAKRGAKKKGISYEDVVIATRKKLRAADTTKITRPIAANVELTGSFSENQNADENGSNKSIFYIAINPTEDGQANVAVEPYRYNDNDISIYADAEELLTVMNGKKNIYDALADGNIHIHGNTKKAILLIHAGF